MESLRKETQSCRERLAAVKAELSSHQHTSSITAAEKVSLPTKHKRTVLKEEVREGSLRLPHSPSYLAAHILKDNATHTHKV